jgi:hypothetical protein
LSQISLNLVAIAIFAMVMSTLLGPWLHLSPFVPAIATFSVLAIATIDNLGWQGRGSTLLLDWLASFSPEHRERVVCHEAGHFLVAYCLDIPITGYTLSAWEAFQQGQPGLGGVSFDTQTLDTQIKEGKLSVQLIDQYCIVWMAGIAAETLVYGNAEGGADDRQTIRFLWAQLQRPVAEAETKTRWAQLQAKSLIEDHRAAYDVLVEAMTQGASVEDCKHAIESAVSR